MENKDIYKDLSEIKERTASIETQLNMLVEGTKKIESVKDVAVNADNKANSAHRRLDRIDKWIFAIGSTVVLSVVGALLTLIM